MSLKELSKKKLVALIIDKIDENDELKIEINYYKEQHEGLIKEINSSRISLESIIIEKINENAELREEINCHKKHHTGLLEKIDYYEEQQEYFLEESKIKTNILTICHDSLEEQAEEIKKSGELIEKLNSVIVNQAKQINYLSRTEKD